MEQELFKILIVDDSLFNREILRRMLVSDETAPACPDDAQCIVVTATSGKEALEKAIEDKPDLILLDIIMPGMSGFEVLEQLKASEATKSVPVIIVSGLTDEEDEEKGLSLGAVDYIAKPFKKAIVIARIKTHLKIVEQMRIIERLSYLDVLTNIPNRRSFDKYIAIEWKRSIRENNPLGILMVDIDFFKNFNDKYGHRQGDEVLKTVSAELTSALKRPADFAARWGGEEFIVLLPNTGESGAAHVAEQIRLKIENTIVPSISDESGPDPLKVTVSIGVASIFPSAEDTAADLIEQADKALYRAKESGRNRVCSQQHFKAL